MKARAGQGVDQMSPVDIRRLPDEGIEQLTSPFEACADGPRSATAEEVGRGQGDRAFGNAH
eukprot:5467624-Pyramimonas_sp.AAC.1